MVTIDTNIAFYAMATGGGKARIAKTILQRADFLSVQLLNEYAFAVRRKLKRSWMDIEYDISLLRDVVPTVYPINGDANHDALDLARRYDLQFFDALMLAVARANGATTFFSEDMQDGLVVENTLTIRDPFANAGA